MYRAPEQCSKVLVSKLLYKHKSLVTMVTAASYLPLNDLLIPVFTFKRIIEQILLFVAWVKVNPGTSFVYTL